MKQRVKITKKIAESLNLDFSEDQMKDLCIKRIHYDSQIDEVAPLEQDDGYTYGVITSIDVDSDGDVILPKGIDLSRFEKNPVVLYNHKHDEPIAYAEHLNVMNDKIVAKTKFSSTKEAQKIRQLLRDKVLRTHSCGIIAMDGYVRGEPGFNKAKEELLKEFPEKFKENLDKINRIVTKSLLVEYSIVSIPSNTECLITETKAIVEETGEENENTSNIKNDTEQIKVDKAIEQTEEIEEVKEEIEEEVEEKSIVIRVIKKANPVKVISTKASRELQLKKELYKKCWGV